MGDGNLRSGPGPLPTRKNEREKARMLLKLEGVLDRAEIAEVRRTVESGKWVDGSVSGIPATDRSGNPRALRLPARQPGAPLGGGVAEDRSQRSEVNGTQMIPFF